MSDTPIRHSFMTRIAHIGLGLAIIVQLLTSLVLVAPAPDAIGNAWFNVHQVGGLSAFVFMVLFWLVLTLRRAGTAPGLLFPWFSGARLSALWADTRAHLAALTRLRLPPYQEDGAFAGAIHGLGLLLVTAMAASGTLYFFINTGNPDAGGLVGVAMFVHLALANLVWVYLIGHSALAVIHHFTANMRLGEMWSLRRPAAVKVTDWGA
tara:strand:- start:74 stop:697 length:624 start_codon:yes stop_codon:yes gene_type:complete